MNLIATWNRLKMLPGGKRLFSFLLGKKIPYSGSMRAEIMEFAPGYARIELPYRRRVQNHLDSVHAVALMNLAELTSGLAMIGGLPNGLRGILVGFRIEYLKKARGRLHAEVRCVIPTTLEKVQKEVEVEIKNQQNDIVCRAHATWLISPTNK